MNRPRIRNLRGGGPRSIDWQTAGLTMPEILVVLPLLTLVSVIVFGTYMYAARTWDAHQARMQVEQNLRVAADLLVRETRLAGACLPDVGPLRAFDGRDGTADGRDADVLVVHTNLECAKATLSTDQANPSSPMEVDVVDGFQDGQQAYILHQDTTVGEFFVIERIETGATLRIVPQDALSRTYPANSTVRGAQEQAFAVDASGSDPVLTIDTTYVGGAPPEPAVRGIESLNVRLILNRAADTGGCIDDIDGWCVVNPPAASSSDWRIIREIELSLAARSLRPVPAGDGDGFFRLSMSVRVKPRNLIYP